MQAAPSAVVSTTRGRSTGTPSRSASACANHGFAAMPPSMRKVQALLAPSRCIAASRSRVWKQTDCSAAVTISPMPLSRVSPRMAPRACGSQCGAPSPVNAGTR